MTEKPIKLPFPDNLHLQGAVGWLELGNYREANEDLKKITPSNRTHPLVHCLRCKIYAAAGRWEMARIVARGLSISMPDDLFGWLNWAYALHKLKRTKEAYDVAVSVVTKFAEEATLLYNLACYACQLGNLPEAMKWLKKAMDLDSKKEIKLMALEDPDLEPLWFEISDL